MTAIATGAEEPITPPLRGAAGNPALHGPVLWLWRVLGSFWLSIACMANLFLLVWLSTLEQRLPGEEGALVNVIERYFESWFVRADITHALWNIEQDWFRLVLPAGLTVQVVLFFNLVVGGMIRMRWDRRRIGILITHFSFAGMLIAGVVEFLVRDYGVLSLWEPAGVAAAETQQMPRWDRGRSFVHYTENEIVVIPRPMDGAEVVREVVFPAATWAGATTANARGDEFDPRLVRSAMAVLESPDLPFALRVHHVLDNCRPVVAGPMVKMPSVDGVFLLARDAEKQTERNSQGCYVQILRRGTDPQTGAPFIPEPGVLWQSAGGFRGSFSSYPVWTVSVEGRDYGIGLRRKTLPLPFEVALEDVVMEPHPGTQMAQEYSSHIVIRRPGGGEERAHVTMNEPVVRDGYKFFQSSWGPTNAHPDAPHYTGLAVSRNPADRVWWIAVGVLALGLGIHFLSKLQRYRVGQQRLLQASQGGQA